MYEHLSETWGSPRATGVRGILVNEMQVRLSHRLDRLITVSHIACHNLPSPNGDIFSLFFFFSVQSLLPSILLVVM